MRVDGPGTGEVMVPGLGTCASLCTYQVAPGTVLTLTASASMGPLHGWWGGACDGSTAATCTVIVDEPRLARVAVGEGAVLWARPWQTTAPARLLDAAAHADTLYASARHDGILVHGTRTLSPPSGARGWVTAAHTGSAATPTWAHSFALIGNGGPGRVAAGAAGPVATLTWTGALDLGAGPVSAGSGGAYAGAVVAFDPGGTVRWSRTAVGTGGADVMVWAVATADDGSAVVGGEHWGTVDLFGQSSMATNGGSAFVVAFAPDGTVRWRRTFTGPFNDAVIATLLLPGGDVIIGGAQPGTVDFGGGPRLASTADDAFLVRLAAADGAHVWSHSFGTTGKESVNGLARAPGGGILANLSCDHSTGTLALTGGVTVTPSWPLGQTVVRLGDDGVAGWARFLSQLVDFGEPATPRSRLWLGPRTVTALSPSDGSVVLDRGPFPSGDIQPHWKLIPTDSAVFAAGTLYSQPLEADGVTVLATSPASDRTYLVRIGTAAP